MDTRKLVWGGTVSRAAEEEEAEGGGTIGEQRHTCSSMRGANELRKDKGQSTMVAVPFTTNDVGITH